MEENKENLIKDVEKEPCCCEEAVNRFIISTAFKNDSFEIQGSFFEYKKIHITYYGKLTKQFKIIEEIEGTKSDDLSKSNIYMYYCFDNKWEDKKIINMADCKGSYVLSYCINISLPQKGMLYIAFTDGCGNWDTDTNSTYSFKIYPDKEKEILERYGLNKTIVNNKQEVSSMTIYGHAVNIHLKNLINKIKSYFKNNVFNNND